MCLIQFFRRTNTNTRLEARARTNMTAEGPVVIIVTDTRWKKGLWKAEDGGEVN
jgi:hypothetical protein